MNKWLPNYAARDHLIYADYYSALEDGHGGLKGAVIPLSAKPDGKVNRPYG